MEDPLLSQSTNELGSASRVDSPKYRQNIYLEPNCVKHENAPDGEYRQLRTIRFDSIG